MEKTRPLASFRIGRMIKSTLKKDKYSSSVMEIYRDRIEIRKFPLDLQVLERVVRADDVDGVVLENNVCTVTSAQYDNLKLAFFVVAEDCDEDENAIKYMDKIDEIARDIGSVPDTMTAFEYIKNLKNKVPYGKLFSEEFPDYYAHLWEKTRNREPSAREYWEFHSRFHPVDKSLEKMTPFDIRLQHARGLFQSGMASLIAERSIEGRPMLDKALEIYGGNISRITDSSDYLRLLFLEWVVDSRFRLTYLNRLMMRMADLIYLDVIRTGSRDIYEIYLNTGIGNVSESGRTAAENFPEEISDKYRYQKIGESLLGYSIIQLMANRLEVVHSVAKAAQTLFSISLARCSEILNKQNPRWNRFFSDPPEDGELSSEELNEYKKYDKIKRELVASILDSRLQSEIIRNLSILGLEESPRVLYDTVTKFEDLFDRMITPREKTFSHMNLITELQWCYLKHNLFSKIFPYKDCDTPEKIIRKWLG